MVDDLTAFVTARLDEDEAAAMSAASDAARFAGRANWSSNGKIVTDAEDPDWAICDLSPFIDDECMARHIARHDPARVLREVAAKRAHLAAYDADVRYPDFDGGYASAMEDVLKHDAAVYSDHPDYRAEWRP